MAAVRHRGHRHSDQLGNRGGCESLRRASAHMPWCLLTLPHTGIREAGAEPDGGMDQHPDNRGGPPPLAITSAGCQKQVPEKRDTLEERENSPVD